LEKDKELKTDVETTVAEIEKIAKEANPDFEERDLNSDDLKDLTEAPRPQCNDGTQMDNFICTNMSKSDDKAFSDPEKLLNPCSKDTSGRRLNSTVSVAV